MFVEPLTDWETFK